MKLRAVTFGETSELADVTVTLTANEAAFIARFVGGLTDNESEAILPVPHGAHHDIYAVLVGEVFNRLYENGVRDYVPV